MYYELSLPLLTRRTTSCRCLPFAYAAIVYTAVCCVAEDVIELYYELPLPFPTRCSISCRCLPSAYAAIVYSAAVYCVDEDVIKLYYELPSALPLPNRHCHSRCRSRCLSWCRSRRCSRRSCHSRCRRRSRVAESPLPSHTDATESPLLKLLLLSAVACYRWRAYVLLRTSSCTASYWEHCRC